MGLSKCSRSHLKEFPKLNNFEQQQKNKVVLDYKPMCKIKIDVSVVLQTSNKCGERTNITHQIMYVAGLSLERYPYYLNVECTWWVSSKETVEMEKRRGALQLRTLTNMTSSWVTKVSINSDKSLEVIWLWWYLISVDSSQKWISHSVIIRKS